MIKKHLRYLSYVLRHKWFVLIECIKLGILWRGIVHDLSKFHPSEWFPYADQFYGDWRSDDQDRNVVAPSQIQWAFERAWNHHQKRNDHHWQYWVRLGDDGTTLPLSMSDDSIREMLADWRGASRAITGKDNTREWYLKNAHKMQLSIYTRVWITGQLNIEPVHLLIFIKASDIDFNSD